MNDRILVEARNDSVQLEQLAIDDLKQNIDGYLQPNWRTRRMVEDWASYVASGGKLSEDQYFNFRYAYPETKGKSHKVFSDVLASHIRNQDYDISRTIFGNYMRLNGKGEKPIMLSGEDDDMTTDEWQRIINGAVRNLELHGWWKSKILVPAKIVASLKEKAEKQLVAEHGDKVQACYEGKDGAPIQLKVNSVHSSGFDEMYEIASDPLMLAIVQQYMGVPPIFNTPICFLNSFAKAKNDKALSDVAQLYHHDMHRLSFVKIFVYLTDVDEGSGPHTLVRGTHRNRPGPLWADGRHSDADIAAHGLTKDEVRITGRAGTVFLVDTSCLHKGSHPETNARLIAQVQYCNSLFGKPIPGSDHKIETALKTGKDSATADLVRKYVPIAGVRFMQNYI